MSEDRDRQSVVVYRDGQVLVHPDDLDELADRLEEEIADGE